VIDGDRAMRPSRSSSSSGSDAIRICRSKTRALRCMNKAFACFKCDAIGSEFSDTVTIPVFIAISPRRWAIAILVRRPEHGDRSSHQDFVRWAGGTVKATRSSSAGYRHPTFYMRRRCQGRSAEYDLNTSPPRNDKAEALALTISAALSSSGDRRLSGPGVRIRTRGGA